MLCVLKGSFHLLTLKNVLDLLCCLSFTCSLNTAVCAYVTCYLHIFVTVSSYRLPTYSSHQLLPMHSCLALLSVGCGMCHVAGEEGGEGIDGAIKRQVLQLQRH